MPETIPWSVDQLSAMFSIPDVFAKKTNKKNPIPLVMWLDYTDTTSDTTAQDLKNVSDSLVKEGHS